MFQCFFSHNVVSKDGVLFLVGVNMITLVYPLLVGIKVSVLGRVLLNIFS
jgi:hypothetical protein